MIHAGTHAYPFAGLVQPAQAAPEPPVRHRLMPRDPAHWNPLNCLVAVIDDPDAAGRAAMALLDAGLQEADVCLIHPREIIAQEDARRRRSLLVRLLDAVRSPGDEGIVAAAYAAEARRGHYLLVACVRGEARVGCAHALLAAHSAHTVHYFGKWIIRGL